MFEQLRRVALFADLSDGDMARICAEARQEHFDPGDFLLREGEAGDLAYVVTDGQVEILKHGDRREVLLAVRGQGEVIGEIALLQAEPRSASVRARTETEAVSIPKSALDDLLATSPTAARSIFSVLLRRMKENNEQLRHQERMVQLGSLTAGVAHELNNPASAVQRAAEQLTGEAARLAGWMAGALGPTLGDRLRGQPLTRRTPLEISDAESRVEEWLAEHGVAESWALAPDLVDAGIDIEDLERLNGDSVGRVGGDTGFPMTGKSRLADVVRLLAGAAAISRSTREIAQGASRLSEIVRVLASYAYLDRAPVQEIDVVRGIEDTLVLLGRMTEGIRLVRDYEPDLPVVTGIGVELNQVWTTLLTNAFEALAEAETPVLTLRAFRDPDNVVVEIEDNGPGIPPEARDGLFDAFYTERPARGSGLGLHVSYRIVALEHRGDLTVRSEPGSTTFRVVLPFRAEAEAPTAAAAVDSQKEDVAMPAAPCEHLKVVENTPKPEGGCQDCLAVGDEWVHLRFCTTCGRIGCCNDSKNQHATKHAAATGHPVLRTKEPGENWAWCVVHGMGISLSLRD